MKRILQMPISNLALNTQLVGNLAVNFTIRRIVIYSDVL